ncbi:MAG: hypothetical protein FWG72_08890 [Oscillospiraceae bacterium]|nr:hypothetical protein [Oscillospiraceae bacterium]
MKDGTHMEQGQFCFITDAFFTIHDKEHKLMRNRETFDGKEHGRPCFYAFEDRRTPFILWCIPVSSKVDKYMRIYNHKLAKQREKGIHKPKCSTIRFGDVMGARKAFLIQNMFPVTKKYIGEIYINRLTQEAVRIPQNMERDIIFHADEILRLVKSGNKHLVFSDIIKTYNDLNTELEK